MARKVKNPEMLSAEIHTLNSKLISLQAQLAANNKKLERLQSTNDAIRIAAKSKKERLEQLMTLAKANGISF